MALESVNVLFSWVHWVILQWDKLKGDVLVAEEAFDGGRSFIVVFL